MLLSMVSRAGTLREREVSFSSQACSYCSGREDFCTKLVLQLAYRVYFLTGIDVSDLSKAAV